MIVDKIYTYLSSEGKSIDEALRYEVEKLAGVSFRRQFMTDDEGVSAGKLRLSSAGKCARQLAYSFHGFEKKGKELDARSKIIFFQGDLTELMLSSIAKLAGCQLVATGLNQATVKFKVNGQFIEGHTDGLLMESGEIYLVEFKSMSSFSFDRFQDGLVDDSYLAQFNCYMDAAGLNKCVFIGMNKDNGVLHEMVFTKDDKIVSASRQNLLSVLKSTPEALPSPAYEADEKGFYPWQCLYCSYWGHCRPNAEKVLVKTSYKLKEKTKEK